MVRWSGTLMDGLKYEVQYKVRIEGTMIKIGPATTVLLGRR
jgi:hypothetical protein